MKDTLVVRLPQVIDEADTAVEWILFDSEQQKMDGTSTVLSDLASVIEPLSESYEVRVIVPADDVVLTSVSIPSKQARQIRQALPFMVEELIADDIETVHLATPSPLDLSSDKVSVAIVDHKVLIHWLDLLHSNHLSPLSITTDVLCIPHADNEISVVADQQRVLIRAGHDAGVSCEMDCVDVILSGIITEQSTDESNLLEGDRAFHLMAMRGGETSDEWVSHIEKHIHDQSDDVSVKKSHYQEDCCEVLATHYLRESEHTLNLLQGGYRVGTESSQGWQRWTVAASVAAIGVSVYILFNVLSGFYFSHNAEKLESNSIALYKKLFPNERRIVSVKKQMENHLKQLSSGSGGEGFLPLLAQTSEPLNNKNGTNLEIQQLRFDTGRSDLQLQVLSKSIDQLDQFKQTLATAGLAVDINSATEQDNAVQGRLVVRKL